MHFEYGKLSPVEFERLCSDLIGKLEGVRYQLFGEGRDDGIDLLNEDSSSGKTIIQCKRYRDTSKLIRALEKTEVSKVKTMAPRRYCLLTSASLTPKNKRDIQTLFSPFIATTQDIWGCDDLDQLLAKNEYLSVVYNVPSLWLPSFKLVSAFTSNAIRGRSKTEIEEMMEDSSRLAWTSVCDTCMKQLERSHVAVLEGDPGIGKTATARMLVCRLLLMGYEVFVSYDGIKEFEDVYHADAKQVFLFDDFLGSHYFEAFQNREDSKICQFAKRVSRDPEKRFILTSRTTILNRGLECSTVFQIHEFANGNQLVRVNDLTDLDKAHVFYKLLSSSRCTRKALVEYVLDKRYWKIIRHSGFNPRVLDYILHSLSATKLDNGPAIAAMLDDALSHPMKIWGNVFENQISRIERVLVWVTCLNRSIREPQLEEAFDKLSFNPCLGLNQGGNRMFSSVSRTLVGSLLKRTISCERFVGGHVGGISENRPIDEHSSTRVVSYALQNPSIADYLSDSWRNDTASVKLALELLNSEEALIVFLNMTRECNDSCKKAILLHLTSDECTAKNVALRLRAHLELVNLYGDPEIVGKAFSYVRGLNVGSIGRQSADSFVRILEVVAERGLPVGEFLSGVSGKDIRQVFRNSGCIQAAIALYSLSPKSVFVDIDEVRDVVSRLLVEYGQELLDSWDMPILEYDEESGMARASSLDVENTEERLLRRFSALFTDKNGLKDVVDVWRCIEEVDVAGFYETEFDPSDNHELTSGANVREKQIDDLFANLAHDR